MLIQALTIKKTIFIEQNLCSALTMFKVFLICYKQWKIRNKVKKQLI